MRTIHGTTIDRNELAAELCEQLDQIMTEYKSNRLERLHTVWNKHNAFQNQMVNIISNKHIQTGRCIGIDQSGALVLENTSDNSRFKVFGGEVSLRGAD